MEPSTTNSNEIHQKTFTPSTTHHRDHDHDHDHDRAVNDRERDHKKPLIISCEIMPRQETNSTFLMGKSGSRLESEPSGREKPGKEVSGVVIPERWGQEDLLKDWMDYSTFDELLAPKEASSARQALVAEARSNV